MVQQIELHRLNVAFKEKLKDVKVAGNVQGCYSCWTAGHKGSWPTLHHTKKESLVWLFEAVASAMTFHFGGQVTI